MYFDFLYNFETFLILRRMGLNIIKNVHGSSCEVPVILVVVNDTWIILTGFRKKLKYQISYKSFQCEPNCLMRTDG